MTEKGFSSILILAIGIAVIVALIIGFFGDLLPSINKSNFQVNAPSPTPQASSQFSTYKNDTFGFQFDYPNSWKVTEISPKNEKMLYSILQITPQKYSAAPPPIKLVFAPNPKLQKLSDLEYTIPAKDHNFPVFYSPDDIYTLSGQGLPAYFRNDGQCASSQCQIYTFAHDNIVFQLLSYSSTNVEDQQNVYAQVFNSLKFSSPAKSPISTGSASQR